MDHPVTTGWGRWIRTDSKSRCSLVKFVHVLYTWLRLSMDSTATVRSTWTKEMKATCFVGSWCVGFVSSTVLDVLDLDRWQLEHRYVKKNHRLCLNAAEMCPVQCQWIPTRLLCDIRSIRPHWVMRKKKRVRIYLSHPVAMHLTKISVQALKVRRSQASLYGT